jgi:oligoribonuclease NrnB/cAMP/cGMP phosphodiesterase (DHH superfamily)
MSIIFDLENVLADFSDLMQRNIRFIYSLALLPNPKVAFHTDADGIVSALILKSLEEYQNTVFIPLGYQELHHPKFGQFLSTLNWIAVVDLMPFHVKEVGLYCDHHGSTINLPKMAEVVIYDGNAPSTAYLLANAFDDRLSEELKLLAKLTTITDTAGYTIPPPLDDPQNFAEVSKQTQAWLLDDICNTPESTEEFLVLMNDFHFKKLTIFSDEIYRQRIVILRGRRSYSVKLSEKFEIADMIVIVQGKKKIVTSALVQSLFVRGVKITCVLYPGKRFTGLSFRVNSQIVNSELENLRVDRIAELFSGGGHPRAAGGRGESFESTLNELRKWIEGKNLSYYLYDLRKPEFKSI